MQDSHGPTEISDLAAEILGDQSAEWLTQPNLALGRRSPEDICATSEGQNHVRRILFAIEYGGVV